MTTEEMFLKLSEQIAGQGEKIDTLTSKVDNLENRFDDLDKKVDNLENRFDDLENRFDDLENRFDNLEKDVADMKDDITSIKLGIENYVEPMLRELGEYTTGNSNRITMIEGRTEKLEDDKEINETITEIKQKGLM